MATIIKTNSLVDSQINLNGVVFLFNTQPSAIPTIQTFTSTNYSSVNQKYTFLLGSGRHNGKVDTRMFRGKIYYARLYNNNNLIMNLIPVRKGTVGYMYDKVSGQLFGNAGTGNFILGPDIFS